MSYPGATLLRLGKYGLEPGRVEDTDQFRLLSDFCADPQGFVAGILDD
jgi:predicted ATPase